MAFPLVSVVFSATFWVSLYFYVSKATGKQGEWNCRILTVLHAGVMCVLSFWNAFVSGPWPLSEPGGQTTMLQEITMIICLGYFLFDMSWCLYSKTEGMVMLLHHGTSIVSLILGLKFSVSGAETVAAIGLAEVTNPLLQLRWFLKQRTWNSHSIIVDWVEYCFAALFLFVRLVIGTYFLMCITLHPRPVFFVKFGGWTIYLISCVFAYFIIRHLLRKVGKQKTTGLRKKERNGVVVCASG